MKHSARLILTLGLTCTSSLLWAADVPGSLDLPGVPRLADAQIVDYTVRPDVERIYPMGSIRKISGRLRFEAQLNTRGQTTAVTYELPAEHSATEAFTAAREALQAQGNLGTGLFGGLPDSGIHLVAWRLQGSAQGSVTAPSVSQATEWERACSRCYKLTFFRDFSHRVGNCWCLVRGL